VGSSLELVIVERVMEWMEWMEDPQDPVSLLNTLRACRRPLPAALPLPFAQAMARAADPDGQRVACAEDLRHLLQQVRGAPAPPRRGGGGRGKAFACGAAGADQPRLARPLRGICAG
jgi:hypothetical protein